MHREVSSEYMNLYLKDFWKIWKVKYEGKIQKKEGIILRSKARNIWKCRGEAKSPEDSGSLEKLLTARKMTLISKGNKNGVRMPLGWMAMLLAE